MPDRTARLRAAGLLAIVLAISIVSGCQDGSAPTSDLAASDPNVSAEEDGEEALNAKSKTSRGKPGRPR